MNRLGGLTLLVFLACRTGPHDQHASTWVEVPNAHARCFAIQQRGEERRALVFGPGGRTDTLSIIPLSGRSVERMATLSTTHVPYVLALGLGRTLVGVAHGRAIPDTAIARGLAQGTIQDLVRGEQLDREQLIALGPELLFDQPFGRSDLAPRVDGPLQVMVSEYLEEHPLGRAEWLRFFGAVLGVERQADSLFAEIALRYEAAKGMVDGVPDRPTVFYGSGWEGRFHAASGNSLMAMAIRDAGGDYWLPDSGSTENVALDVEAFLALADTIDHVGMAIALDGVPDALDLVGGDGRLARARSVAVGGFHGNSRTCDLFGRALLEPDVVLKDLIHLLHPERLPLHQPVYFRRVGQ
jgi:iron complex transport system substrate-binding protein